LERKQREERLFTRGSLSTFPSRASRHGNVALALCGLGHYGCAQLIPTVNEIWFVWNLNWSWQAFISEQNGAYRKTGTQQWGHDPYWIGRNRAPAPSMSLVQRVNPSQATMREIGLLVISIYLPQDVHIYRELYGHDGCAEALPRDPTVRRRRSSTSQTHGWGLDSGVAVAVEN
jgi:hypothetical protein